MTIGVRVTALLLVIIGTGCDEMHGASVEVQVPEAPSKTCLANALAPLGARLNSKYSAPDKEIYDLPLGDRTVTVIALHAQERKPATLRVAWAQIERPTPQQADESHKLMAMAYNRIREGCGGLPPIAEVQSKCWRLGCREQ